jgi:hypothetical protein
MKQTGTLLLLFSLSLSMKAQEVASPDTTAFRNDALTHKVSNKFSYAMSTGTSFSYAPGFASGTSVYLAPQFRWNFSPKLKVDAGFVMAQNRMNFQDKQNSVIVRTPQTYNGLVYATSNYAFGPRLSLSGSFEKNISTSGGAQMNQMNGVSNDYQSMSMGLDYKISPSVTVGVGVRMQSYSNPFYPYNSNMGYSPFSPY